MLSGLLEPPASKTLQFAELYLRAARALTDYDYSNSIVQSWALIELLITDLWDRYVEARREARISMTIALTGTVARVVGELPKDLHEQLDTVRRARNKWIHELKPVSADDADAALALVRALLKRVESIELHIETPRQISL